MESLLSLSQRRRQRLRRTAVRQSLLASLELRDFVTGRLSLPNIIAEFPLPNIFTGYLVQALQTQGDTISCFTDMVSANCKYDDRQLCLDERSFHDRQGQPCLNERLSDGIIESNFKPRRPVTTKQQPTTLENIGNGFSFCTLQSLDGRVDRTARVEVQGPVKIRKSVSCFPDKPSSQDERSLLQNRS